MKQRPADNEVGHARDAGIVDAMRRVSRPASDAAFDAELLGYINVAMQRGDVRIERVVFGSHSIAIDFALCAVTCHTQMEWIDISGKRRLIAVDQAEYTAKQGALVRLLGHRGTAIRLLPEGLQIDIEGAGTLHFSRIDRGVSFELSTAQFGPALY